MIPFCGPCHSSTACNIAVKILAPKFGRLSYHYSKAMRMDWFNGKFKCRCTRPYDFTETALREFTIFPMQTIS